ncbi:MAG TPA: ABC transporter permease [Puia sp.]|nr:ABC transporter permease [Puia sp.]
MLNSFFTTAWRNLINNKVYSALNIIGLGAGMAVALLIGLWVLNEYSYDRFLPGYQQVYQVEMNRTSDLGLTNTTSIVSLPLAASLRKDIPEVAAVAESDPENHDLLVGDKKLYSDGAMTGEDFLSIFHYPMLQGDPAAALHDPYSIVLTASSAKALFGDTDAMGKTVRIDNEYNLKVTGILQDIPKNSSLQFNYLIPFSYKIATDVYTKGATTSWYNNSFRLFVALKPNADYAKVAPKIKDLAYNNAPKMRPGKPEIWLHPLKSWRLWSDFREGKSAGGFIDYVRMFSIIGFLVLLIACINFMNLSTARSERRAREVGVRKAIGSQRRDLILQFLFESILTTGIATILAIFFVQLALPSFNVLTNSAIQIPYSSPLFWLTTALYTLLTGLLAGSRPALYLSSFNAVNVLKGDLTRSRTRPSRWLGRSFLKTGQSGALARKILVTVQFTCSIALIISTIIIYQQVQYAKDRPLGYSSARLLETDMSDDLFSHYDALRNDLIQTGLVRDVAKASSSPTYIGAGTALESWPGKADGDLGIPIGLISASANYFRTLGMQMLEGRDFNDSWAADTACVILNEAAVHRTGLKHPVNQIITWNGGVRARIIGVVKDALMESPFEEVKPLVFTHGRGGNAILYRLTPGTGNHEAIAKIAPIFNHYNPTYPYMYKFVDEEYNKKFGLETLVGKLASLFAALAIFISCLGLFGLAAYVAEQRTKEIGVRKVLGASVSQIWFMLSKDFLVLILLSALVASPIALYFLHHWLLKYDYRITIGPAVFILAALAALLITLATISFQAIRAANANPVNSLRTE